MFNFPAFNAHQHILSGIFTSQTVNPIKIALVTFFCLLGQTFDFAMILVTTSDTRLEDTAIVGIQTVVFFDKIKFDD